MTQEPMDAHVSAAGERVSPRRRKIWPWILAGVLLLLLIAALVAGAVAAVSAASFERISAAGEGHGTFSAGSPYVAVLYVEDTMTVAEGASLYHHDYLLSTLEMLTADADCEALLVYVDSPGGEVIAAAELGEAIAAFRETGRPVYSYGHSAAASGGYWVACTADSMWMNRYCTTGSIGVMFSTIIDASGLLERYGIRTTTITSGEEKGTGSLFEPMTEETVAIYQAVVDEYYGYFVDWVAENRGMAESTVRTLADGRVYTASQAAEAGLIDHVGDYEDALNALLAEVSKDCDVVEYREISPLPLLQMFYGQLDREAAGLNEALGPQGILAYYPL